MNGFSIFIGLIISIAIGMNFGMWMQDFNAGTTAFLVTFTAFSFRYDND